MEMQNYDFDNLEVSVQGLVDITRMIIQENPDISGGDVKFMILALKPEFGYDTCLMNMLATIYRTERINFKSRF